MLKRLFTEHPAAVDESYGEHFTAASGFGLRLFAAALACLVHACLPFLFAKTASAAIAELHDRMVANRHGERQPTAQAAKAAP